MRGPARLKARGSHRRFEVDSRWHWETQVKRLITTIALVLVAAAPLPAFAGRDAGQIMLQERANAKAAQGQRMLAQAQTSDRRAAAGPAGDARAAKEGPAGRQMELLKRFHPKHAYGS